MKKLPDLPISSKCLFETLMAPLKTNAMISGIRLGIFDELEKAQNAAIIAEKKGFNYDMLVEFLKLLAASGLITLRDGVYKNTPETDTYLVSGKPTYLGDLFLSQDQSYNVFSADELEKRVINGFSPPKESEDLRSAECWEEHASNMANWERSGTSQVISEIITSLPEFPSMKRMLDLGGGPGLMGIGVMLKNPDMSGFIFDQATVTPVTQKYISEYNLQSRLGVISGDYMTDSFGTGYDLIMACFTLNFAGILKNEIMKKIFDALNPGGVFVSLHDGMFNGGTEPGSFVLANVPSNFCGYFLSINRGEIADAMINAGFSSIQSKTVDLDFGPADLDIARK